MDLLVLLHKNSGEMVDETKRLMLIIFEQSLLIKMITPSKTLHYSVVTFINTPAILSKKRQMVYVRP